MQSFIDLANSRRSTRKYLNKKIDRKDLDLCIESASISPSACNNQPWKFIVVDDHEKLKSKVHTG